MRIFLLWTLAASAGAQDARRALTLNEAWELAEKQSPEIQLMRLRTVESEAVAAAAGAAFRPQVDAVMSQSYQTNNIQGIGLAFPGFPSRVGPYRLFNARPVVRQTIVDLSLVSSIRAARERVAESRYQVEVLRETTLFTVLQLFLHALEAESRMVAATARLRTVEAVLGQTRDQERAGAASKLDLSRAEQQFESEEVVVIVSRRDRDVLKSLLLRAIGSEDDAEFHLQAPGGAVPDEVSGDALARAYAERPELKALASKTRSAREQVRQSERQRWPKISFAADFGVIGPGPDRSVSTYTVGAAVSMPISTGGRIAAETAQAAARAAQVEQEVRQARIEIANQVRQARTELHAARAALLTAEKATAAARESVELAQLRFGSGISNNIDVVEAQQRLAQAEDLEIRMRYEAQLGLARLAHAQGNVRQFLNR